MDTCMHLNTSSQNQRTILNTFYLDKIIILFYLCLSNFFKEGQQELRVTCLGSSSQRDELSIYAQAQPMNLPTRSSTSKPNKDSTFSILSQIQTKSKRPKLQEGFLTMHGRNQKGNELRTLLNPKSKFILISNKIDKLLTMKRSYL